MSRARIQWEQTLGLCSVDILVCRIADIPVGNYDSAPTRWKRGSTRLGTLGYSRQEIFARYYKAGQRVI